MSILFYWGNHPYMSKFKNYPHQVKAIFVQEDLSRILRITFHNSLVHPVWVEQDRDMDPLSSPLLTPYPPT